MDLTCPQCHQSRVRKVSGIYKEQGRLPPPKEPQYERMLPANSMHVPVLHLLGHIVGYPMAFGVVFLTTFLACGSLGVGSAAGAGTGVFLFLLGGALIIAWVVRRAKAVQAARHTVIDEEYPRWQRAYQKWDRSYYCEVCDQVFVLNSEGSLMAEGER